MTPVGYRADPKTSKARNRFLLDRDRQDEVMEEPGLDARLHRQALRGLGRINRISQTARHFWPELERLAKRSQAAPLRVLDVACGGGDIAIELGKMAEQRRVPLEIQGCDVSPTALDYARERAALRRAHVSFFEHDVLEQRLPTCDAIVCSLFLHHLSHAQALSFLAATARAARFSVQVSDLVRGCVGYAFAQIGCRLLSRSKIVHIDGPRSVAAAFTVPESHVLAEHAGLETARILRRFPERFHLIWSRA